MAMAMGGLREEGQGENGELRMEIWALKNGIGKGEEVLVSYGKGWWGARKD
jgi:hypothetical protein